MSNNTAQPAVNPSGKFASVYKYAQQYAAYYGPLISKFKELENSRKLKK